MTAHATDRVAAAGTVRVGAGGADRNGDGRFRVLATERPFSGKIVTVRIDDVAMPGGTSARREVVEHMRAVAVVAIDASGNVVLIEQYRHPLRRRLWELPAGLMDVDGELPADCAARELAEETGLAAARWTTLVDLATSPGFCTETIRVYLAKELTPVDAAPPQDEEADLTVVRVPLADAVAAVLDGRIVNATAVAGLLAASQALTSVDAPALRPAADPWLGGPATVSNDAVVGTALPLG